MDKPECEPVPVAGRRRVPASRRLVSDVLTFSRRVPTCAQNQRINLAALVACRDNLATRVSWPTLFLKAFSAVSLRHPRLLQTWRNWPWPHVYQHSTPVAFVATHRRFRDDDWLFWSRVRDSHCRPLIDLQRDLDTQATQPVEQAFRQQWQLSQLPTLFRRIIWWMNLELAGEKRAKRLGTFILTTVSGKGVEIQHPPGVLTCTLTYGPIDQSGTSLVTLVYDHRLMDGSFAADCLNDLDRELNTSILGELQLLVEQSRTADDTFSGATAA